MHEHVDACTYVVAVIANLGLLFFFLILSPSLLSFAVIVRSLLFASAAFYFNISVVGSKFVKFTKCMDHGPSISVKT